MLQTPIKPYTKPEMAEGEREREGESKKKMAASRSPRRQETRIKDGLLEEEDEEEEEEERKFGRDGACSGDEDGELCLSMLPQFGCDYVPIYTVWL